MNNMKARSIEEGRAREEKRKLSVEMLRIAQLSGLSLPVDVAQVLFELLYLGVDAKTVLKVIKELATRAE